MANCDCVNLSHVTTTLPLDLDVHSKSLLAQTQSRFQELVLQPAWHDHLQGLPIHLDEATALFAVRHGCDRLLGGPARTVAPHGCEVDQSFSWG